jgi:hypothetical protein
MLFDRSGHDRACQHLLNGIDRAFLTEFASKTCYTHPAAALALHRSAAEADEVGAVLEGFLHLVGRAEAEALAARNNTAALVQSFVVVRLLAQLAAAIEDCAALGDAIRFRARGGLFARYLASKGGVAGDFFDAVRRGGELPELLGIPELVTLDAKGQDLADLTVDYEHLPRALREVAEIYRGQGLPRTWTDSDDGAAGQPDNVNIVIDVIAAGSPVPRVTLLEAYNKIKHRFAMFDDIARLGAEAGAEGYAVIYATYPRDPAHTQVLFANTATVARVSGEIAALFLKLDGLRFV